MASDFRTLWTLLLATFWRSTQCVLYNTDVSGGILLDPPGRSLFWRESLQFKSINHQQNCGGIRVQWLKNGGKCGICGDPWNKPRDYELGGKYFKQLHVNRTYTQNSTIHVTILAPNNLLGYFEFRIASYSHENNSVSQYTLDRNILRIKGTDTTRYRVYGSEYHVIPLQLPENLTCDRCLLQWKYHTGRNWGCDNADMRSCCYGCGRSQEEFYDCTDINVIPPPPQTRDETNALSVRQEKENLFQAWWCLTQCVSQECFLYPCNNISRFQIAERLSNISPFQSKLRIFSEKSRSFKEEMEILKMRRKRSADNLLIRLKRSGKCVYRGTGLYYGWSAIDNWCQMNCELGYCPGHVCATDCTESKTTTSTTSSTTTLPTTALKTTIPTTTSTTSSTTPSTTPSITSSITTPDKSTAITTTTPATTTSPTTSTTESDSTTQTDNDDTPDLVKFLSTAGCSYCNLGNKTECNDMLCGGYKTTNLNFNGGLEERLRKLGGTFCDFCATGDTDCKSLFCGDDFILLDLVIEQRCQYCAAIGDTACTKDISCEKYVTSNEKVPNIEVKHTKDQVPSSSVNEEQSPETSNLKTKSVCSATGFYKHLPDVTKWCQINCPLGYCPETHCRCKNIVPDVTTTVPTTQMVTTTTSPTSTTSTTTQSTTTTPNDVDLYSVNALSRVMCDICQNKRLEDQNSSYGDCIATFCNKTTNLQEPSNHSESIGNLVSFAVEMHCEAALEYNYSSRLPYFCDIHGHLLEQFIVLDLCVACRALGGASTCNSMYCNFIPNR